jgi:hypothetical protein
MAPKYQTPPYGLMAVDLNGVALTMPPKFNQGSAPEIAAEEYKTWFATTLALLQKSVWPVWDQAARRWNDGNDQHTAEDVEDAIQKRTAEDLRVGLGLQQMLDEVPTPPFPLLGIRPHKQFFLREDEKANGLKFPTMQYYDRNISPELASGIETRFFGGMTTRAGSVALQFKQRLQRPRAFQIAFLLEGEAGKFVYHQANTAHSPAMISGHGLQGLMGGVSAVEALLSSNYPDVAQYLPALWQFAIDMGDRRAMAGVHYPSDNLASWIVALRLTPHVTVKEHADEILRQLSSAIKTQSAVYSALKAAIAGNSDHPLAAAWKLLHDQMPAEKSNSTATS